MDRARSVDAAAIFAAKLAVSAAVLALGFTHVSDDDYARTVIAERFAHAPTFDPSGTSWLPFPFWVTGTAMIAFGRSLAVARGTALCASGVTSACAYLGLRALPVARWPALAGIVVAMALPWSAWLGAADVPEGFFAPLLLVAMTTMNGSPRARALGAVALLAATLSRYEAWPVAAVFFLAGLARGASPARVATHALPLAGPLGWMAWNLHAHGSATHFLARVAAYRDAVGASGATFGDELAVYPRALAELGGEPLFLGFLAIVAFCIYRDFRTRWSHAFASAVSMLAFLVYGETRGGAPTHHPERALLAVAWLLVAAGIDAAMPLARKAPSRIVVGAGLAALVAWLAFLPGRYRAAPGNGADEDRAPQIARGLDLRSRGVVRLSVVPCAYEHFALLAAYGAPENVAIAPIDPKATVGRHADAACPLVTER